MARYSMYSGEQILSSNGYHDDFDTRAGVVRPPPPSLQPQTREIDRVSLLNSQKEIAIQPYNNGNHLNGTWLLTIAHFPRFN